MNHSRVVCTGTDCFTHHVVVSLVGQLIQRLGLRYNVHLHATDNTSFSADYLHVPFCS